MNEGSSSHRRRQGFKHPPPQNQGWQEQCSICGHCEDQKEGEDGLRSLLAEVEDQDKLLLTQVRARSVRI